MARDLKAIKAVASNIRLKSLAACPDSTMQVLEFAKKKKMQVLLGVFINNEKKADDEEFAMLEKVLKKYDESVISGVVVGDGFIFDLGVSFRCCCSKSECTSLLQPSLHACTT